MVRHARLVYKVLGGRFHVYTSPDVKGLHASAETKAGAQREAIAILDLIAPHEGAEHTVVEFLDRLVLQAAE